MENDADIWRIPEGSTLHINSEDITDKLIDLDIIEDGEGKQIRTLAIEGDWHDIPFYSWDDQARCKTHEAYCQRKTFPVVRKGAYFAGSI